MHEGDDRRDDRAVDRRRRAEDIVRRVPLARRQEAKAERLEGRPRGRPDLECNEKQQDRDA